MSTTSLVFVRSLSTLRVEYGIMLIGEIYKTLYKDFFNFSPPNLRASSLSLQIFSASADVKNGMQIIMEM